MADTSLKYFNQVLSVITQFDIPETDSLEAAGLKKAPETERVNADYISKILRFVIKKDRFA